MSGYAVFLVAQKTTRSNGPALARDMVSYDYLDEALSI